MTHSEITIIGLTLTFALMASGPQPPPLQPSQQGGGYTLRQNTKLVLLDIVVTDKKGNLVPNLKKEDFEIQEDKQPQRITSFEAPGAHALPANVVIHSTEELDRLAPDTPVTIIVLDEFSEKFSNMAFAHYSIQHYLKPQPKLLSQPTMLLAVNIDHFVVLHDYTQDKDAILAALDHHVPDASWRSGSALWWREQLYSGFRSLTQVAQSTTGHPGHKNIIWVGHGFPPIPEGGLRHEDAVMLKSLLQKEVNLLQAARVTLYTANPRGVGFGNEPFRDVVNMAQVAKATGGKWFFNRNDVDAEIGTSARDGQEFYTLSYIPTSSSEEKGAFRNVRIVMKNPNFQATTRLGYYPNPESEPPTQHLASKPANGGSGDSRGAPGTALISIASKPDDKRESADIGAALGTTLVYDGIPVTLTQGNAPGQAMVHVDSTLLPWVDHGPNSPRTVHVRVVSEMYEKNGKAMKRGSMNIEARIPAIRPGSTPVKVKVDLPLRYEADPRAVRLRVVVQAIDSGKIGTADLDIPAK